jgi:hypothetical protein
MNIDHHVLRKRQFASQRLLKKNLVSQHFMRMDALFTACEKGDSYEVRGWLEDWVNHVTHALSVACDHGHADVAHVLLQYGGAKVDQHPKYGWTDLINASDNGCIDVVEVLLDHGASASHQAKDGWTALALASNRGHSEIVHRLAREWC